MAKKNEAAAAAENKKAPQEPPKATEKFTVNFEGGVVNVREAPGYDGKVLCTVEHGKTVKVNAELEPTEIDGEGWMPVIAGSVMGWMSCKYLK